MMVAVLLGALSLGGCVENEESASVTEVRGAKAAQLNALATKAKAEAEAALILANAEKAYKEAEANYKNAQAEAIKQETADAAFELQKAKDAYERDLEAIKKEAEKRLWEAKKAAAEAEQQFLAVADKQLKKLYASYSTEAGKLVDLQAQLEQNNYDLKRFQASLITVEEFIATQVTTKQASIDKKTAEIAAWKTYSGVDKAQLENDLLNAQQDKYAAFVTLNEASVSKGNAGTAFDEAAKALDADNGNSSLKTVAAVEALRSMGMNTYTFQTLPSNDLEYEYQWNPNTGRPEYIVRNCMQFWVNGSYKYIQPIKEGRKELSKEYGMIAIPYYTWNATFSAEVMTQYFAQQYDRAVSDLGVASTEDFPATGLYANLEQAQADKKAADKNLATAKEDKTKAETALEKGKTELAAAETEKKTAEAAVKKAQADKKTAETDKAAAQKEYDAATTDEAKAAAQLKINVAQIAINAAVAAEGVANGQVTVATNKITVAEGKVSVAKNNIANANYAIERNTTLINESVLAIKSAEDKIAKQNLYIAECKKGKENAGAIIASFSGNDKTAYDAAVKALETGAAAAYETAWKAYDVAQKVSDDIDAKIRTISQLIQNPSVVDAKAKIAALETEIANLKKDINDLRAQGNGTLSAQELEQLILTANASIAKLKVEIEVQQSLTDLAKKALDAALGK